jgi:hypothetical protein
VPLQPAWSSEGAGTRLAREDVAFIGSSVEGRPLAVEYCGDLSARPRVFVIAGQHGDEPDARLAASQLIAKARSGEAGRGSRLAVLADANPDGAAAGQRRNAADIDLNRDHLLLRAPETLAIHRFVERWKPDLILDVHTYRPRKPELLQFDYVFPHDVMLDVPTNPAARTALVPRRERSLLEFVERRLAEVSLRCDRYTLVRPSGRVRHSNLDIVDARNGLSLRFGIPTLLIEGRRRSDGDPPTFAPTEVALLRAAEAVLDWAEDNSGWLGRRPATVAEPVPIGCRYSRSGKPRYMEMQTAEEGAIRLVGIPGAYLPIVQTTRTVTSPKAYAVPRAATRLIDALSRQRFRKASAGKLQDARLESYRMLGAGVFLREPAASDLLADAVLYSTDQAGGRALALLLEPGSRFGLHRFLGLDLPLLPGSVYPIARVV